VDAKPTNGRLERIDDPAWQALFAIWLISLTATLGSLFFSEVMRLPPCVLCWYQRVCMYPLVVVATVGVLWRDPGALRYAWPLAVGGLAIAIYHNLLYYHLIPESITPCTTGVSCTSRQIEWLGFITIPLMSLAAFTLIVAGLFVCQQRLRGLTDET
jgi:disulfide bond formation protein DsbB